MCPNHEKEKASYYCDIHHEFLCYKCILVHQDHIDNIKPAEEREIQDEIDELCKILENKKELIDKTIKILQNIGENKRFLDLKEINSKISNVYDILDGLPLQDKDFKKEMLALKREYIV